MGREVCGPSPFGDVSAKEIKAAYYLREMGMLPTGPESRHVDLVALADQVWEAQLAQQQWQSPLLEDESQQV